MLNMSDKIKMLYFQIVFVQSLNVTNKCFSVIQKYAMCYIYTVLLYRNNTYIHFWLSFIK